MRKFIAFTGVKESGKSSSFKFIKEAFPEVIEVTIAEKLKDTSSKAFNVPRNWFDDQNLKERDLVTPVYLSPENVTALLNQYPGYTWNYDTHVRPHVGQVLYSARRVAQYIGTEILRAVHPDIHCLEVVKNLPEDGIFIITDMRFPNEFGFFQTAQSDNFFPLFITNYAAEAKLGAEPHASEKYVLELGKKCEKIDNNGSLLDLREKVLTKYKEIISRKVLQRSS